MTRIKIKTFKQLKEEGWKLRGEFMHPANNPHNGVDEEAFNFLGKTVEARRYNDNKFVVTSNDFYDIYIPVSSIEEIYGEEEEPERVQQIAIDNFDEIVRRIHLPARRANRFPQPVWEEVEEDVCDE